MASGQTVQGWISRNPSITLLVIGLALVAAAVVSTNTVALAVPLGTVGAACLLIVPFADRLEGRLRAGPVEANLAALGEHTIDERIEQRLAEIVARGIDEPSPDRREAIRADALSKWAQTVTAVKQVEWTSPNTLNVVAEKAAVSARWSSSFLTCLWSECRANR